MLAVVPTYGGPYVVGMEGWEVDVPHVVGRHGLILIIALGESVVAIAALLAMTVAGGLWWAYFAGESDRVEQAMRARAGTGLPLSLLARDVYSYLHIPLTLGIVLAALGIKLTLGHPGDVLHDVAVVALGGGVAGYFAALAAVRVRIGRRPKPSQVGATVAALAVTPATPT